MLLTSPTSDGRLDVRPLNEATKALFAPVKLMPNDRLRLAMNDDLTSFVAQAYAEHTTGGQDRPGSYNAMSAWAVRIPERRELGYGRWLLKATDFAAIMIGRLWPMDRIEFTEDARTVYTFLITRFAQQTHSASIRANYKVHGIVPDPPDDWEDHPVRSLSPYQFVAAVTSTDADGSALFMDKGTGKTPIAIRVVMQEAAKLGRMYRTIVVCPRNVRTNWRNEFKRFATLPGKVVILRGGQLDRVKQLIEAMTIDGTSKWTAVICSYETLSRSWDALRMVEWDRAIADESHLFKSTSTRRYKFMEMLRDRSTRRLVLTATPMANNVADYYPQLEFLGTGLSGFSSYKAFREYYNRYTPRNHEGQQHELGVNLERLPLLQERLSRLAFMISKEEALPSLPGKQWDVEEVSMTKAQRELYVKVQRELAAEIEDDLARASEAGGNIKITASNALTKLLRLSQITAGYAVSDKEFDENGCEVEGNRTHAFKVNPKIDALIAMLKEKGPKEKTIVWSCWVPSIRDLSARLTAEGIEHVTFYGATSDKDREAAERRWNEDPTVRVFIGNPAAGGVGLNLPGYVPDHVGTDRDHGCNADHTVFFACNWSMIQRSQAEDRNHGRNRNRKPVRVTDLVIPGTIDEEIRERVLGKIFNATEINDLRDLMRRILEATPEADD